MFNVNTPLLAVVPISNRIGSYPDFAAGDYGETLVELWDETWNTSVAQWMGTHWDVLVDLWTKGEGRSDLVLKARVRETESGLGVTVELVYVP